MPLINDRRATCDPVPTLDELGKTSIQLIGNAVEIGSVNVSVKSVLNSIRFADRGVIGLIRLVS